MCIKRLSNTVSNIVNQEVELVLIKERRRSSRVLILIGIVLLILAILVVHFYRM